MKYEKKYTKMYEIIDEERIICVLTLKANSIN